MGSGGDSVHHPFTAPRPQDAPMLDTDPGAVTAQAYDLVCNGYEMGGGSIRIHARDMQETVLGPVGVFPRRHDGAVRATCCPRWSRARRPHGGIAMGIDRIAMLLAGEEKPARGHSLPKDADGVRPALQRPVRGGASPARRAAPARGRSRGEPRMVRALSSSARQGAPREGAKRIAARAGRSTGHRWTTWRAS